MEEGTKGLFWGFNNNKILFITKEVVFTPLLMCSKAKDSGLVLIMELVILLKNLIKGTIWLVELTLKLFCLLIK